jgi:hypothetical protein
VEYTTLFKIKCDFKQRSNDNSYSTTKCHDSTTHPDRFCTLLQWTSLTTTINTTLFSQEINRESFVIMCRFSGKETTWECDISVCWHHHCVKTPRSHNTMVYCVFLKKTCFHHLHPELNCTQDMCNRNHSTSEYHDHVCNGNA